MSWFKKPSLLGVLLVLVVLSLPVLGASSARCDGMTGDPPAYLPPPPPPVLGDSVGAGTLDLLDIMLLLLAV